MHITQFTSNDNKAIVIILLVLLAVPIVFITFFETNLHCTQYTSFKIAIFDMEMHVEEAFDSNPLICSRKYAVPLRIYFAFNILLYLFSPFTIPFVVYIKKMTKKSLVVTQSSVLTFFILNIYLSYHLAGERLFSLNIVALLLGLILYPLCHWISLFTIKSERKNST